MCRVSSRTFSIYDLEGLADEIRRLGFIVIYRIGFPFNQSERKSVKEPKLCMGATRQNSPYKPQK
jgi:hypothetical protein